MKPEPDFSAQMLKVFLVARIVSRAFDLGGGKLAERQIATELVDQLQTESQLSRGDLRSAIRGTLLEPTKRHLVWRIIGIEPTPLTVRDRAA